MQIFVKTGKHHAWNQASLFTAVDMRYHARAYTVICVRCIDSKWQLIMVAVRPSHLCLRCGWWLQVRPTSLRLGQTPPLLMSRTWCRLVRVSAAAAGSSSSSSMVVGCWDVLAAYVA